MYHVGAPVLVTRSSGEEAVAIVEEYDAAAGLYTVAMQDGNKKRAPETSLRALSVDPATGAIVKTRRASVAVPLEKAPTVDDETVFRFPDELNILALAANTTGDPSTIARPSVHYQRVALRTLDESFRRCRRSCLGRFWAAALAEMLRFRPVVDHLDLDGYPLPVKLLLGVEPVKATNLASKGLGVLSGIVVAKLIESNKTLKALSLFDNQICTEGGRAIAETLKRNGTLTSISLGTNCLGPEGSKAVADALMQSGVSALTTLSLYSNHIGPEGGLAMARLFKTNLSRLTDVNLAANFLGPDGAKAIASALKMGGGAALNKLDLQYNIIGDEAEAALRDAVKGREGLQQLL